MKQRNAARRSSKAALGNPASSALAPQALRPPVRRAAPVPSSDDVALLAIGSRRQRAFAGEFVRLTRAATDFADALLAAIRVAFPRSANIGDDVMRNRARALLNAEPVFGVVRALLDEIATPPAAPIEKPMTPLEIVIAYPEMLPKCSACGARTRWRQSGSRAPFVACGAYPRCRETTSLEQLEKMLAKRSSGAAIHRNRATAARKRLGAPGRRLRAE